MDGTDCIYISTIQFMQELLFQYIIPFENRPKSQHEENNMTQNQTE